MAGKAALRRRLRCQKAAPPSARADSGINGTQGASGSTGGVVAPVPGVKETPRMACPAVGGLPAEKLSLVGSDVAERLSVTATSEFGSAPWSPSKLTVEVVAQLLRVPL